MSATNRGSSRLPDDQYYTPQSAITPLFNHIRWDRVTTFLEPCEGNGAITTPIRKLHPHIRVEGIDINSLHVFATVSYLTWPRPSRRWDLIITNPPFTLALEFLTKSLAEASTVIYLLRLNFLASQKRLNFWRHHRPTHLFPLSKRPSFTGTGTDATDYAWFAWDFGQLIDADFWLMPL